MNNKIELGWGHARFLYPYWEKVNLSEYTQANFGSMDYKWGTDEIVKTAIKALHIDQKNAVIENKHIVVGNGSTHLLTALIHSLGGNVYAEPPHFTRFPTITRMAGRIFSTTVEKNDTQIITVPNNPDGEVFFLEKGKHHIYDLSYNWKQYTNHVMNFDKDIMVFSLSKATGHASTRIGWAVLSDVALAKKVEDYIEFTTAGVSIESQKLFLSVVNHQMSTKYKIFDYGRDVLKKRWDTIEEKAYLFPFDVLNSSGMFLYAEGECPEQVVGINGSEFGDSKRRFRLNIGCSEETFNSFIGLYE